MKISFKVSLLFLVPITICAGRYSKGPIRLRNTLTSPFSLSVNLIALYFAGDKHVRARIKGFLRINGTDAEIGQRWRSVLQRFGKQPSVKFLMVSGIFVSRQYRVSSSYDSLIHKYLNMSAFNINFSKRKETSKIINTWINKITRGNTFIPVEIPNDNYAFVMPNFIQMKVDFRYPFSILNLQGTFLNNGIKRHTITMMRNPHLRLKYKKVDELKAEVIQMPLSNPTIRMLIFLPKNPKGLPQLQKSLRTFNSFHIHRLLKMHHIDFSLPTLNEIYTNYLEDYLFDNRLHSVYGIGAFPKIAQHGSKIYLNGLAQTVSFKMNEEGIAPWSNLTKRTKMNKDGVLTIEVNHPFAFRIQDSAFIYIEGYIHNIK